MPRRNPVYHLVCAIIHMAAVLLWCVRTWPELCAACADDPESLEDAGPQPRAGLSAVPASSPLSTPTPNRKDA